MLHLKGQVRIRNLVVMIGISNSEKMQLSKVIEITGDRNETL